MTRAITAVLAALIIAALSACAAEPLPPERQRLLAFGASLAEKNSMGYERVYTGGSRYKKEYAEILSSVWQITDSESAKAALSWLRDEGIRAYSDEYFNADEILDAASNPDGADEETVKLLGERIESYNNCAAKLKNGYSYTDEGLERITTTAAFDYDRLVTLARWCAACGYLSEDELWAYAEEAAAAAKESYSGWEEYFAAIEIGRALTQGGETDTMVADKLLKSEDSPYKKYKFKE